MFTGIVQATGSVIDITELSDNSKVFAIDCRKLSEHFLIGESININGVCLSIEKNENGVLTFTAVKETLDKTNLGNLEIKDNVNLERAATLTTLLGGHLVSGHVDKILKIININKSDNWTVLRIEIDHLDKKYLINKGSIAINGVSLTISDLKNDFFEVNLIPQTLSETNLNILKVDDYVNIEFDLIGKYVLNKVSSDN
ncbi:MAG: hypothetical protein RLZZ37_805 [Actinomycetota bacterium]|jgi:riboflavin synthase